MRLLSLALGDGNVNYFFLQVALITYIFRHPLKMIKTQGVFLTVHQFIVQYTQAHCLNNDPRAVLPLRPYVAIFAQCVCKWAQKNFRNWNKKVLFLFIQPFLSQKLIALAQGYHDLYTNL